MSPLLKIICVLIFLFWFFSTFGLQMGIILIAGFITFAVIVIMVSSNQSSTNVRQTIVPLQVPPNENPKGPAKESFSDTPFTTATFGGDSDIGSGFTVDNLTFAPTAVPEPSSSVSQATIVEAMNIINSNFENLKTALSAPLSHDNLKEGFLGKECLDLLDDLEPDTIAGLAVLDFWMRGVLTACCDLHLDETSKQQYAIAIIDFVTFYKDYYCLNIPDCNSIDVPSFLHFYVERTEYFGMFCNETLDLCSTYV